MSSSPFSRANHRGVALVIVLAFVVLLTGLIVAFFSQALIDRQISNSSANATKADLFAQGAIDTITGDLKQEIAAGSVVAMPSPSPSPANGAMLYTPNAPQSAVVCLAGSTGTAGMQNLLKRSAFNVPFYANPAPAPSPTATPYNIANYAPSNRAANVPSTAPSLNGRYVSPARWNQPLLLPKKSLTTDSDLTPVATFIAPDWVLVGRDGSNPSTWNSNLVTGSTSTTAVIGRYAYNIYDEGGLLDMNVAGYPSTSTAAQSSYKNALAYADLTQLTDSSGNPVITQPQIDQVVAWRNYASASTDYAQNPPATGATLGTFLFPGWNTNTATNYFNAISANGAGFMHAANPVVIGGPPGQTDRVFAGRQELINLLLEGVAASGDTNTAIATRASLQNALQFMGTFSRGLSQPSYIPALQTSYVSPALGGPPLVLTAGSGGNNAYGLEREINPSYLTVRALKTFIRSDGSTAGIGDPLVSKRFPLQRLAWLTYKGPSQGRPLSDPDIQALVNAGISYRYLQLGTASNIQQSFGLNWNGTQWLYNVHNNGVANGKGPIMRVGRNPTIIADIPNATKYVQDLASPRDPDFFELLKSAISVGSIGKSLVNSNSAISQEKGASSASEQPYNYNYDPESSVDRQVIQIGANIINQSREDNYPVQIFFDDGVGNRDSSVSAVTISGVVNLPYLYNVVSGVLQVQPPAPLPRFGKNSYTSDLGTGVGGNSGYLGTTGTPGQANYVAGDTITASGVGVIMQMPVIWNPHDPSSPVGVLGPTQFRVVADSATPDAADTGTHNSFFAFGASLGVGNDSQSFQAGSGATWFYSPTNTGKEIASTITAANSAIYLTPTGNVTQPLFPQPAVLLRSGTINDYNGNSVKVSTNSSHRLATDPAVAGLATNGGLPCYVPNEPLTNPAYAATTPYLGFYMGAFPFAWANPNTAPSSAAQSGAYLARYNPTGYGDDACYMTYRMQYMDAGGNWVTYDTKYGKAGDGENGGFSVGNIGSMPAASNPSPSLFASALWAGWTDPRTSRFGLHWNHGYSPVPSEWMGLSPYSPGVDGGITQSLFFDPANGLLTTDRPDAQTGFFCVSSWANTPLTRSVSPGWMAWVSSDSSTTPGFAPGLLEQNNTEIPYVPSRFYTDNQGRNTHTPNYFADPDGMVRRAMGGFVPIGTLLSPSYYPISSGKPPAADTTVGLPLATAFWMANTPPIYPSPTIDKYPANPPVLYLSQAQSRPYFLHRPFLSVAELGGVFSDTPWRNLDFATSETGSAALLDVFCVNESDDSTGLVAGRVNLNTKQTLVLAAILKGGYLDPASVSGNSSVDQPMDVTVSGNVATALANVTQNSPLQNVADLAGKWVSNQPIQALTLGGTNQGVLLSTAGFYDGKLSYSGFSGGQWDSSFHQPKLTNPIQDVYSAYSASATLPYSSAPNEHNGPKETAEYVQRFREAPVRALSAAGQTRVWNLMIDLVAQTGRYPTTASDLTKFNVEGEQRYWIHLAIDRASGRVVDKQVEVVKE
jgi:hypothetical protein